MKMNIGKPIFKMTPEEIAQHLTVNPAAFAARIAEGRDHRTLQQSGRQTLAIGPKICINLYININCAPCKEWAKTGLTCIQLKEENGKIRGENEKLRDQDDKLRGQNEKLRDQNEKLRDEAGKLRDNINDLITCQICLQRFQSAGERIPCKLKCPHIMCKKCAEDWLKKVRDRENPKLGYYQ